MRCESIHLNRYFPILGENGKAPVLTVYLPEPFRDENLRKDRQ